MYMIREEENKMRDVANRKKRVTRLSKSRRPIRSPLSCLFAADSSVWIGGGGARGYMYTQKAYISTFTLARFPPLILCILNNKKNK